MSIVGCGREEVREVPAFAVSVLTSSARHGVLERASLDGLNRINSEMDVRIGSGHAEDERLRRELIRVEGQKGTTIVFCVGRGFETVVFSEAPSYPESYFVLVPGSARAPNVGSVSFRVDGAGYVAGVVAALLSSPPVAAVVQGEGGSWLDELEDGFVAGFDSRRRGWEMLRVSGSDGVRQLASQKVSVALYSAEIADAEVIDTARSFGVMLITADEGALEPNRDVVLASLMLDVGEAMSVVIRRAQSRPMAGRVHHFDIGSGAVLLRLGTLFDEVADLEIREQHQQALEEVAAGIVEVESLGM
jgi:basic membrane lipoprotein Med (substrate-binding protein (PBP1-ABC) superfamily)